ncbi:MAG: tRNA uridine-5-carboxymethylaminomethyl(34) synthesis GTPase MnmE, partial [Candidatus Cloacimonadota bacterium]|nr:tRNA uridine-5-carboxymethylaminomethyl(34) synthesis GTPase MnmE [Candidatus Cloacimonadota bacterium]
MNYSSDTIIAISTASGKSGIAVIRLSGIKAFEVADKFFRGKTTIIKQLPNTIQYGKIFDNQDLIDEVVITKFQKPNSYTGEDVIEIS